MRFYCYSTYKFSPTGFAIGYVDVTSDSSGEFYVLKPSTDVFVRKCFEYGEIKRVYGKNGNTYWFMEKGLKCEYTNEDNMPSHKVGNFLFEFSGEKEYIDFVKGFNRATLTKAMDSFIVPDSSVAKFALKIRAKSLKDYIRATCENGKKSDKPVEVDGLLFETDNTSADVEQMLFEICGDKVISVGQNKYSTKKKSFIQTICLIMSIIVKAVKKFIQIICLKISNVVTAIKKKNSMKR